MNVCVISRMEVRPHIGLGGKTEANLPSLISDWRAATRELVHKRTASHTSGKAFDTRPE